MGLTQRLLFSGWLLALMALAGLCQAADGPMLETGQWPEARECPNCVPVQFGRLEMHLPLSDIGRILVHPNDTSALHILPQGRPASEGVVLLAVARERLLGRYEELGLLREQAITTPEQFFDALGRSPGGTEGLAKMRRIEHLDSASRYIKASKGPFRVYWIQSSPPNSQYVHFVVEGEDTVYLLAGNVTPGVYEAVLSNLRLADIP